MSTPQLMPNLMTGNAGQASKGMQALGMPPVGNAAGSNMPGATSMLSPTSIAMPAPGALLPPTNNGAMPTVAGAPANNLIPGGLPGAVPTAAQGPLQKQLDDTYGKGEGGELSAFMSNLGSNDSTYMQAYTTAMAPQNAEAQATLNTTLGNSGISMDSSTAAIANADLLTGQTTQEGLQEQQLQQMDQSTLAQMLTSTEGATNKEASTSIWGDVGDVLGGVGTDVVGALGPLGDAGLL